MNKKIIYILLLFLFSWNAFLYGQQRFPKPDFESGYEYPSYHLGDARSPVWEYIDVAVLVLVLTLTTRFTLKTRSRNSILLISVFSLLYFGFFREGCICSIGAIQNIALALFNNSYTLPLSALLFFLIPILFTIGYGRQFCAGACPLGAIQELTGIYPVKLPKFIETLLSTIPYIYLALSILFAATESNFIICKYDPYVGIFRLNGPSTILIFGILLLVSGIFVNRPYCRFLCPYGVILNWVSRFSNKHLTITPNECINCRLCETSCPYEAIIPSEMVPENQGMIKSRKRFTFYLILLPLLTVGSAFFVSMFAENLAYVNPKVKLAVELQLEKENGIKAKSIDAVTFKESGKTIDQLMTEKNQIIKRFETGTPWVGGFLGLSLGIALILTTLSRKRDEYKPDQGKCYSCGRCFEYCPIHVEKLDLK
ncbi:MAG: 4Fe-4S binding protein [Bacteroidales bacterium]|nr:4Fe-4S binding protein [Bacteroidales bacterium]